MGEVIGIMFVSVIACAAVAAVSVRYTFKKVQAAERELARPDYIKVQEDK